MESNQTGNSTSRDYATISPSAYSLLLKKGLTPIPYARQAAELLLASRPNNADPIAGPKQNAPNPNAPNPAATNPFNTEHQPPLFWARLLHFENRYWSIDQLMQSLDITNILELSSGFSFRGLALSREKPVYYIDTDLPELIATKQQFVDALTREPQAAAPETAANPPQNPNDAPNTPTPGHYELLPLNVLDAPAFHAIAERFPPGPLLILNEGLLVYLDLAEKEALCRTIRSILQQRGGYWITGDIYIQKELDPSLIDREDSFHQFLEKHKIEEKKFADFESAAEFFTRMGFIIDREATTDISKLSALPKLLASLGPEAQKKLSQTPRMHATWRLRVQ